MAQQYFRIEAPAPAIASTLLLPQPEEGNLRGVNTEVKIHQMMDGTRRTYVKRGGLNKTHRWNFRLSDAKVTEFCNMVERYRGKTFRCHWRGRVIEGKATLNPLDIGGAGSEYYNVTFELIEE